MKKTIIILILAVVALGGGQAAYGEAGPIWLFAGCGEVTWATVGWFNPPAEALPFEAVFPAILTVVGEYSANQEIMFYAGATECPLYEGCVVHRWLTPYNPPVGDYYLSAYIENAAGETFEVLPERLYPGCEAGEMVKVWLPMVRN